VKVRICFSKTDAGRFLSHLDVARSIERALRRAKAPLAFSEGFNPHPKISFASALAVGTSGLREYLDVELSSRVSMSVFSSAVGNAFPPALAFVAAEEIMQASKSLSAIINLAVYTIVVTIPEGAEGSVIAGIEAVLASTELWRRKVEKPGKKAVPAKEVRGLIKRLELVSRGSIDQIDAAHLNGQPAKSVIEMELYLRPEGQLRPQELLEMVCEAGSLTYVPPFEICRSALLIEQSGKVFAPMG
jgi:radical SAM-linked protein